LVWRSLRDDAVSAEDQRLIDRLGGEVAELSKWRLVAVWYFSLETIDDSQQENTLDWAR
jgi:hypothetical protein